MKSNQQFSFERNRYYPGKMLTSADFQAEQDYFNNKRRFINHMMYGSGVICGLDVYSLDDLSVYVESGAAIDGFGREIVVNSSVVKKISTLEGFEELKSDRVSLCLKYKEEKIHPVYSINRQEQEDKCECNRISEGYELFLADTDTLEQVYEMENEFLSRGCLLDICGCRIELVMPSKVCAGNYVKCRIIISNTSETEQELSYEGVLQMPGCTSLDGSHEVKLHLKHLSLDSGAVLEKEYWVKAQDTENTDMAVLLRSDSVEALVNGRRVEAVSDLSMKIVIADIYPGKLVDEEIGRLSLEMRAMGGSSDFLRLADMVLVQTEASCIIEKITGCINRKYIETPAEALIRKEYLDYFKAPDMIYEERFKQLTNRENLPAVPEEAGSRPRYASGTLEIPIGGRVRKGDICYSGEIMHGLGSGDVYVQIGFEYLEAGRAVGANVRNTVYGNPELFKNSELRLSNIETAVKVLNDKGSFFVAVRFSREAEFLVLTCRWVAVKLPSEIEGKKLEYNGEKGLTVRTPTVVLGIKESYFFDVDLHNLEHGNISYEVTENGGGEITADGVYTAPNKEGIFEIRIFSLEEPFICTYAYAIVKRKGPENCDDI